MSRRLLLSFSAASALLAAPAAAAPFKPIRISVAVRGSGPDVVLIPGLSASRGIWNGTVAAVPGYRYHLVQVAGFAGTPAAGNAAGKVAAPVADEIARYIAASRLDRPAIVGHSMGGSIAMMIGARHPELAGRVMVVDMLPSPARPFGVPPVAVKPLARLIGGEMEGADRLRRDLKSLVGTVRQFRLAGKPERCRSRRALRRGAALDRPDPGADPDPGAAHRGLCVPGEAQLRLRTGRPGLCFRLCEAPRH